MARAPKDGKSGPTETVATTLLLPSAKLVKDLVQEGRNVKKRTQSIAGEFGEKIAAAVENKHLDRKALSLARTLDALADEKLHVTYIHLMEYIEWLGIKKRALAQEELFEDSRRKPGEDEEDFQKGPRLVTETAGSA
jgi:hypothetical protein